MRKALTSEAIKNGLDKTAAAHHLQVVTTPPVNPTGVIPALPDGTQLISRAFAAKADDPPQSAPTGEGFAVFQVKSVIPAHAPTFADWKSHVADDYRNEQVPALLSQKTAELAAKAKAENDLAPPQQHRRQQTDQGCRPEHRQGHQLVRQRMGLLQPRQRPHPLLGKEGSVIRAG